MPNRVDDVRPEAREFSEAAAAIARGRELVKQAHRSAEEANQQAEDAQATMEQSGQALDRSHQLLMKFQAIELARGVSP